MSIKWSTNLITSKLCSMINTVFPLITSLSNTPINTLTSSKWSPVVGSSKIYRVCPVSFLDSSLANLIRCASPPDNVVDDWPKLMYPSPTSWIVLNFYLFVCAISVKSAIWRCQRHKISLQWSQEWRFIFAILFNISIALNNARVEGWWFSVQILTKKPNI